MHIAFLNPQGNFDPADSYLAEHPDFGGQLVYVKEVALAMGKLGHKVDILTRQMNDPAWPEFSSPRETYPDAPNLRILRLPAGPALFLPKELLWRHLGPDWVPNIINFYDQEGKFPDFFSAHYGDGGISAVLLRKHTRIPFSFTAHSLGAQKMDNLHVTSENFQELDKKYHFSRRLVAERTAMNHSLVNITSTIQERQVQYGHPAYQGAVDTTNASHFAVIPPGVNLSIFDKNVTCEGETETTQYLKDMLARSISRERLEFPCIVASSRIDRKKNHLGLLRAYAASKELQRISNLVILTSGLADPLNEYMQATDAEKEVLLPLIQIIEKNELRGQVAMFSLKGQFQLGAAYRYFRRLRSIFTLPALHEPFGLAPLEAMAAGMPAVVTKFGGPSESMRDGKEEFGILTDPSDPGELSSAMLFLLSNSEVWDKYARAGYKRVVSTYNWNKTACAYLEALTRESANGKKESHLLIHPYFTDPADTNDITLAELQGIYRDRKIQPDWL